MREAIWHYRNFYVLFFVIIVIVVIGAWKCCYFGDGCSQACPDEGCFPGNRAWTLGPSNNPSVLPDGGKLILSKAATGDNWYAFIQYQEQADAEYICEDSDGIVDGVFYCQDGDNSLRVEEDKTGSCQEACCISYEFCVGSGCGDSGGELGSDGGGNSGKG